MDAPTIIIEAVTAGAVTAANSTASMAVRDAYSLVRGYLLKRYGVALKAVSEETSAQDIVVDMGRQLKPALREHDEQLDALVAALLAELNPSDERALSDYGINIGNVRAGLSIRLENIDLGGALRTGDLRAEAGDVILSNLRSKSPDPGG